MKKNTSSTKKTSPSKKKVFIKPIVLTQNQAALLCKSIENPKPLSKEVIDRVEKIKNSFSKDFDGFSI